MNFRKVIIATLEMLLTLGIAMTIAFFCRRQLVPVMEYPLQAAGLEPDKFLRFDSPVDSITISLSISFHTGIVISLPMLIYVLARRFLPALSREQAKWLRWIAAGGFLLFFGGVLFSFIYLLPATLRWLHNDAYRMMLTQLWSIRSYYSFVAHVSLAAGLLCELPLVVVTLGAFGLVIAADLRRYRLPGYALSVVTAGLVSPTPDPMMLLLFTVPILLIFEACIWLITCFENRRNP